MTPRAIIFYKMAQTTSASSKAVTNNTMIEKCKIPVENVIYSMPIKSWETRLPNVRTLLMGRL